MQNTGVHPESVEYSNSENNNAREDGPDPPPRRSGSKAQGRKRTKTGCLTCRKRRIKCGEERPICQNCVKSKRTCEGYNKKVVFKDPLNTYRHPFSQSNSGQSSSSASRHGEGRQQPRRASGSSMSVAARSSASLRHPVMAMDRPAPSAPPFTAVSESERMVYSYSEAPASIPPTQSRSFAPQADQALEYGVDTVDSSRIPEPVNRPSPPSHYDFDALVVKPERGDVPPPPPTRFTPPQQTPQHPESHHDATPYSRDMFFEAARRIPVTLPPQPANPAPLSREAAEAIDASMKNSFRSLSSSQSTDPRLPEAIAAMTTQASQPPPTYQQSQPRFREDPFVSPDSGRRAAQQNPQASQYPEEMEEDDDPYDVSSDDDDDGDDVFRGTWHDYEGTHLRDNDLGIVVALQARQETNNLSLRNYKSFITGPNMLATYMPSSQATPLRDPMTARIFCHFVNVTAPSISMYERHPANPSLIFQGVPVPKSQQHIWTYTFPTLALQSPALLHAMLAVASLHIAKIQDGPITASLKHYAIGLRRVAKSVSLPTRRRHPATLAAAMLLAFYEVWSADHQKWSNHLLGAKQLFREIDFIGLTKFAKRRREQQRTQEQAGFYQAVQLGSTQGYGDRAYSHQPSLEPDEGLVGILMGRNLPYEQNPHIVDDTPDGWAREFTDKDLETYETQRDIFWWYCKQDAYQSILGGGRLFMDYTQWSNCPPRAPVGRLNATYGTYDHLILLIGRLADFAAKDLKRKRLVMKANGGQWRPPGPPPGAPGYQGPPPPPPGAPPQPPPQVPNFSGMFPDVQPPQLPMGFSPESPSTPRSSSSTDPRDLTVLTQAAEEEWLSIRQAFGVLEANFGPDFQALGPEFSTPIQTPFGPALQYRTYGIAGIWMNYYMGLIACHRAHPCMPPAAMMAAGIAARQTAGLANEVGRIAGGIAPDITSATAQVAPNIGAGLIESSTCLFVAGVQYQDSHQRHWTAQRLKDIGRLTGWQTAYAICSGCELTWTKAAEMGRGPAYIKQEEKGREGLTDRLGQGMGRRIDRVVEEMSLDERRRFILGGERSDRSHYALGLLSVEEDFEGLDIEGEEDDRDE